MKGVRRTLHHHDGDQGAVAREGGMSGRPSFRRVRSQTRSGGRPGLSTHLPSVSRGESAAEDGRVSPLISLQSVEESLLRRTAGWL